MTEGEAGGKEGVRARRYWIFYVMLQKVHSEMNGQESKDESEEIM